MKKNNLFQISPQVIRSGTVSVWWLFRKDELPGNIHHINDDLLAAGVAIEPHEHADQEEVYYVLSGTGEIWLGDETEVVKQGDAIYIPPRTVHSLRNTGSRPLRFFSVAAMVS